METQITELEKLSSQIETEKDFSRVVELFSNAANLVREIVQSQKNAHGKILEIIRDMDTFIERELKLEGKC